MSSVAGSVRACAGRRSATGSVRIVGRRSIGFLHRHGGKAVFLGRLTAVLRALMPSMAGMSGMRYRTFLFYNAAGGILWGGGCILAGWAFASALNQIEKYLTWGPLAALAVLIVVAGWCTDADVPRERLGSGS